MENKDYEKTTEETVAAAIKRARELDIKKVIVASTTGYTAGLFADSGLDVVCVTHHIGWKHPNQDEMPAEARNMLTEKGVEILTCTHIFAGIDRALRMQFGGIYPVEIVASALRMFGQGLKVCVEIGIMAVDSGLTRQAEEVITVGGTGRGADTAIVMYPYHSQNFLKSKVLEVICKPYDF